MRSLTRPALFVLAAAAPLMAQAPTPMPAARDLSTHTVKLPGLGVRFVDYHWQPALFEAMAKGSRDVPEATRDWVLARIVIEERPLTIEGARLIPGNYALSLFPNSDGKGMAIEIRRVDMREVYPNINALAPTPAGKTVYRGPAQFEALDPLAPRLGITATEEAGTVLVTVSYGDRRLSLKLKR
jgi:hypothetical protein